MENILVVNATKYIGQYVTIEDFGETKVITSSVNALDAYNEAIKLGYSEPVLFYVPMEE